MCQTRLPLELAVPRHSTKSKRICTRMKRAAWLQTLETCSRVEETHSQRRCIGVARTARLSEQCQLLINDLG